MVLSEKPFGGRKQKRKAKQKSSGAGESNLGPLSDNPNSLLTELLFGDVSRDQKSKRQAVSWKTTKHKSKKQKANSRTAEWRTGGLTKAKKPKNEKTKWISNFCVVKTQRLVKYISPFLINQQTCWPPFAGTTS